MDMPVGQAIVRALVSRYEKVTGREPLGLDHRLLSWGSVMGMTTPTCGRPEFQPYGDDYASINEVVLCSRVVALAAPETCG